MSEKKSYRLSGGMFDREEETVNVKRLYFLSVEGAQTEPSYFNNLNKILKEIGVDDVCIHVLKHSNDEFGAPEDVYSLIEECIQLREDKKFLPIPAKEVLRREFTEEQIFSLLENQSDLPQEQIVKFNDILLRLGITRNYREYLINKPSEVDRFAIVIDRDMHSHSRDSLEKIITAASAKNVICCLTNPCFEFWLLLHLEDVEVLKLPETLVALKENRKISKAHTYASSYVSKIARHKKRISESTFNKFYKLNLQKAINGAAEFSINPLELLDEVGSSVPLLLNEILKTESP